MDSVYRNKVMDMLKNNKRRLEINLKDLREFDLDLAINF